MDSVPFYEKDPEGYARTTLGADMRQAYLAFFEELPVGGTILDAGCGAGRDARIFRQNGYSVSAFDASPGLAAFAEKHADIDVSVMRFEDFTWPVQVDGIWANASLLHVLKDDLPGVLRRLSIALKPGGALYASFKLGDAERFDGERHFTDLNQQEVGRIFRGLPNLSPIRIWVSEDKIPGRGNLDWLNVIAKKRTPRS